MPTPEAGLSKLITLNTRVRALAEAMEHDPLHFFAPNKVGGFQEKFRKSLKRCRFLFSGNRSGKTEVKAAEGASFARGEHPFRTIETPNVGWVVSVTHEKSRDVTEPAYLKYVGPMFKDFLTRDHIMLLTNGSKIAFKSADARGGARKFTGASIRWADLDEDIEYDIYKELLLRTFDQKGDIWGGVTPKYKHSNWMHKVILLNQYKDPEVECFFGSMYDNKDYIPDFDEQVERLKKTLSPEELEAVLFGKFLMMSGLIHKAFDDDVHLITPFEIPESWPKFRIIDHGLYDPTAVLWVALSPDNERYYYREYYKDNETIPDNCYWIKEMTPSDELKKMRRSLIDPYSGRKRDPVSKKTVLSEYRAHGIRNLILAPGSEVTTRISKVNSALKERKIFIFRTLVHTIEEFKTWIYLKSGKPQDGNDHCMSCIGFFETWNPKFDNMIGSGQTDEIPVEVPPDPLDNERYPLH